MSTYRAAPISGRPVYISICRMTAAAKSLSSSRTSRRRLRTAASTTSPSLMASSASPPAIIRRINARLSQGGANGVP